MACPSSQKRPRTGHSLKSLENSAHEALTRRDPRKLSGREFRALSGFDDRPRSAMLAGAVFDPGERTEAGAAAFAVSQTSIQRDLPDVGQVEQPARVALPAAP